MAKAGRVGTGRVRGGASSRTMRVHVGAYQVQTRGAAHYDPADPFYFASSVPGPLFFLLLVGSWVFINAFFAALYWLAPGSVANARPGSFGDAFFFSVETLATVGYGNFSPTTLYAHIVATTEILVGTASTAIATGLLFLRFSRPRPRFVYARNPIVAPLNGTPTLMLRIANGRTAVLTDGQASIAVLLEETTAEGEKFRRFHELKLVRPRLPLFPLAWTLMHELGHDSPLHGISADWAATSDARLFVTLSARDHALGAVMHDTRDYSAKDVLFGVRYADAVVTGPDGITLADLALVSEVEPVR